MDDFDLIWDWIRVQKKKAQEEGKRKKKEDKAKNKLKQCRKCKRWKPKEEFCCNANTKDKLTSWCKHCYSVYSKAYRKTHQDKIRVYSKTYYETHQDECRTRGKVYYKSRRQERLAYSKARREKHARKTHKAKARIHVNIIHYKRSEPSIETRLSQVVAANMRYSLKHHKNGSHWESLVPYTLAGLMAWLELQFEDGMNWENYGSGKGRTRKSTEYWVIDHIRPISSFEFNSPKDEEFQQCWALENLRPCWAKENMEKSAKWPYSPPAHNEADEDAKKVS